MSLSELLDDHPADAGAAILHTEAGSLTRGEVDRLVEDSAAHLRGIGVRAGQPVAVIADNSAATVAWMFACWRVGAVYVPINPSSPETERAATIDDTRPAAVVDGDLVVARGGSHTHDPDAAFVVWTSGTTGRPKAVVHTHGAYLELLDRVLGPLRGAARDSSKPPTPNLIPVSLALNAGIYNTLFGLRAGAPVVVMERFTPIRFAELVVQHEIRSTVLPPAAMVMLVDEPAVTDLTPLKYVRSITAPLSPLQARRFTEKFPGTFVLNGYGQAEIGEVVGWTAADAKQHPGKVGAAGRAHPGVGVRITVDGEEVALGEVGDLEVLPPRRTESYATGESVDERVTADGWWRTGDLARIDEDGFVWIEGRVGDVINRGGNKVYPDHVEEALRRHPDVLDAGVVGAPDDRLGEVPVAFVVLRDGATLDVESLEAVCRENLVAYKVPVRFTAIDSIPRNEVGKLLRSRLV